MFVLELIHRDCQIHGVTTGGAGPGWELSTRAQREAEGLFAFFAIKVTVSGTLSALHSSSPHPIPSGSEALSV